MKTAVVRLTWKDATGKVQHERETKLRFSTLVTLGIELLGLLKAHVVFPSEVTIRFE